jgi:glycolate oxidase
MSNDDTKRKLEEEFGKEKVLFDERKNDYSSDMADYQGEPFAVVLPENEDDVVRAVKFARDAQIPIIARGAGSSLTGASVLDDSLVLDMRRMNKIVKIDKINWYVRAQPGITLEQLNKELGKEGFFFPPDPASSYICTLGGAIAEDSGGMRCLKYGTVKEWVLSLRVVLYNGKITQVGEPFRKNRAGYDLVHLFTGSEGTLGIITEACVRIIPIPRVRRMRYLLNFDSWDDACQTIIELRKNGILPDIFEFLDKDTIHMINRAFGYDFEEREATIIVDIEDQDKIIAQEVFERCNVKRIFLAETEEEMERLYSARSMAYLAIKANSTGVWAEDIVVPIEMLSEYMKLVKKVALKFGLRIPVGGHAGDGNVHPSIMYNREDKESVEKAKNAFIELCRIAISMGGSVTGEHGVGIQKAFLLREQLYSHGSEESLRIMKEIKKIFDPEGLMNPGKYVDIA